MTAGMGFSQSHRRAIIHLVRQDIICGAFASKGLRSQFIIVGKNPVLLDSTSHRLGGHAGDQRHGVFAFMRSYTLTCKYCSKEFNASRKDAFYCSDACGQMYRKHQGPKKRQRACKECGTVFKLETRGDANRRYCSSQCAKRAYNKQQSVWHFENPHVMKEYNQNRIKKNPGAWKRKDRLGRAEAIRLLGGKCVVCGVDNPNWLHIDFVSGSRGLQYRHPRHIAYIREHLHEFRLLCANHHYELTLTGKIDGTDITQ